MYELPEQFELPDWLYSVSDIQDYFQYIIKKRETVTNIPQVRILRIKSKNKKHWEQNYIQNQSCILCWTFNTKNNKITWKYSK